MLYAVDGGVEKITEIRNTIERLTKLAHGTSKVGDIHSYNTGAITESYREGAFI